MYILEHLISGPHKPAEDHQYHGSEGTAIYQWSAGEMVHIQGVNFQLQVDAISMLRAGEVRRRGVTPGYLLKASWNPWVGQGGEWAVSGRRERLGTTTLGEGLKSSPPQK